jgi:hypothetical protein
MIRRVLLLVLGIALTAPLYVALAGDPGDPPIRLKKKVRKETPPAEDLKKADQKKEQEKQDDLDLEKELRKQEPPKGKEQDDQARQKAEAEIKELIARLHKNMQASEDRLGQKDPGDATREIQKDILKDLDELLKQSQSQQDQDSQCQDGSCEKEGQGQSQKKNRKSSSKKSGQKQGQQTAKKKSSGNPKSSANKGGKQGQQQVKGDGKISSDTTKGQGSEKNDNRVSELYKDIWGNYPERQRQEMDTYARERFMPRYEELLRQYYRTVSEHSRKTKGD